VGILIQEDKKKIKRKIKETENNHGLKSCTYPEA
jgi:hypothetical protein